MKKFEKVTQEDVNITRREGWKAFGLAAAFLGLTAINKVVNPIKEIQPVFDPIFESGFIGTLILGWWKFGKVNKLTYQLQLDNLHGISPSSDEKIAS